MEPAPSGHTEARSASLQMGDTHLPSEPQAPDSPLSPLTQEPKAAS